MYNGASKLVRDVFRTEIAMCKPDMLVSSLCKHGRYKSVEPPGKKSSVIVRAPRMVGYLRHSECVGMSSASISASPSKHPKHTPESVLQWGALSASQSRSLVH